MKRVLVLVSALTVLTVSVTEANDNPGSCISVKRERFQAFFAQTRPQPVFRGGQPIGWRVYDSGTLEKRGLRPQDLVTHFCGVSVHEIAISESDICCSSSVVGFVTVMIEREGRPMTIMAVMPPNKPLESMR